MLLYGSMIALTAGGLVLGCIAGILLTSRTGISEMHPLIKLFATLFSTVAGFSFGIFTSLFVSPFILRFAFFAKAVGEWKGVTVYRAADEDLPGRLPNVFVAGFSFGVGPFAPSIFVAEGAAASLSTGALEAVFAHEMSHLSCQHLGKRVLRAITTFLFASVLTAATFLGIHWSGYAEIGGVFSLIAGIIPALLTWMTMRQMMWDQELEADDCAIQTFQAEPASLLEAMNTLQAIMGLREGTSVHPLVALRMQRLRNRLNLEAKIETAPNSLAA